jgi:DNA-binding response OmpR family regulator
MTRALVVDDDPMILRGLSAALARASFDVVTAEDGAIALQLDEMAPADVALVDYNMRTPGLVVVRELRARRGAAVYIVVLTGCDDVEAACIAAGADIVLLKPIAPTELRRRLVAAVAARAA